MDTSRRCPLLLRRPWHLLVRAGETLAATSRQFVGDLVRLTDEFDSTQAGAGPAARPQRLGSPGVHELSVCTALVSIVEQHSQGRDVARVHLDVGHLRQIVPATLAYSWSIIVSGTPLADSVLDVNYIPAVIECRDCQARTVIEVAVFRCGCGSTQVDVVTGQELNVTSLDLFVADRT